jgi:hypothetical protein
LDSAIFRARNVVIAVVRAASGRDRATASTLEVVAVAVATISASPLGTGVDDVVIRPYTTGLELSVATVDRPGLVPFITIAFSREDGVCW